MKSQCDCTTTSAHSLNMCNINIITIMGANATTYSRSRAHRTYYPWICNTNLCAEQSRKKNNWKKTSEIPNAGPKLLQMEWFEFSSANYYAYDAHSLPPIKSVVAVRVQNRIQLRGSSQHAKTTFQLLWPTNMKCARSGDGIMSDRRERTCEK